MADEPRPYSERPAARPDPQRIAAQEAEGGGSQPTPGAGGGCGTGCFVILALGGIVGVLIAFISAIIPG